MSHGVDGCTAVTIITCMDSLLCILIASRYHWSCNWLDHFVTSSFFITQDLLIVTVVRSPQTVVPVRSPHIPWRLVELSSKLYVSMPTYVVHFCSILKIGFLLLSQLFQSLMLSAVTATDRWTFVQMFFCRTRGRHQNTWKNITENVEKHHGESIEARGVDKIEKQRPRMGDKSANILNLNLK